METRFNKVVKARTALAILAAGMIAWPALAQSTQQTATANSAPAASPTGKASAYRPNKLPTRAKDYYLSMWGIDNLLVRKTASSNLIRFSYRVQDPERAKALGVKEATPYLIGLRAHAVLQVPVMDKIGQLRQSGPAGTGKEYWMVFSNKGNLVTVGDHVNVVIGNFHADGLIVE